MLCEDERSGETREGENKWDAHGILPEAGGPAEGTALFNIVDGFGTSGLQAVKSKHGIR